MPNIVAIVGRPNVGKSTLFNRLTKSRQAIVDEIAGVTRDRNYGHSDWNGVEFSVIDTGGYVVNSDDIFEEEIRKQASLAIEEADVIVFLVDVENGLTDLDQAMAQVLRKSKKKVFLAVNKVDDNSRFYESNEFYALGMDELFPISAIHGSGTGELLDAVAASFEKVNNEIPPDLPRISIVGKPNVGKSSLLNVLMGEERNIVTPIAGTTRDSINTRYNKFGHDFYLIDTAGLRRKTKVKEDLEFYSVMRSVRTIETSDVCILMLDATMGVESQDMNILQLILSNHKGLVLVVNKWDLVEKDTKTSNIYEDIIRKKTEPFTDYPIVFASALTKQRINKILTSAVEVYENRSRRIPTSELNETMQQIIANYPPPCVKGKFVKIKYCTQLHTAYPSFAFYCNHPQYVRDSYKRYLENQLREHFNFNGVPMEIYMRGK